MTDKTTGMLGRHDDKADSREAIEAHALRCVEQVAEYGGAFRRAPNQPTSKSDAPESDETAENDASKDDIRNFGDTREKLDADVRRWFTTDYYYDYYCDDDMRRVVARWLDRQAAITERECRRPNWEYCDTCEAIAELNGAVCERDGRIGAYERRNTELNDALKAVCNRFGVGTQWSAEDAAKKVMEALERDYMRMPVDADGVPIRPGDVLDAPMYDGTTYRMTVECVVWNGAEWAVEDSCGAYSADNVRHIKRDTVESVLGELLEEARCKFHEDGSCETGVTYERRAEYAERIRRALDA